MSFKKFMEIMDDNKKEGKIENITLKELVEREEGKMTTEESISKTILQLFKLLEDVRKSCSI